MSIGDCKEIFLKSEEEQSSNQGASLTAEDWVPGGWEKARDRGASDYGERAIGE